MDYQGEYTFSWASLDQPCQQLSTDCCETCIWSHPRQQHQEAECILPWGPDQTSWTSSEGTFAWKRENIIMVSLAGAKRVNYVWKFNINVGRFSGTMQRSCLTNSRIIFCSLKPSLLSEVFNFWKLNFIQNCGWLKIIGIIITDQRLCLFVQQMITRILN